MKWAQTYIVKIPLCGEKTGSFVEVHHVWLVATFKGKVV